MNELVSDLLTLSSLEEGAPRQEQRVDLRALAYEIAEDCRPLAAGRELVVRGDQPLFVLGDERRLRQVLLNLIGNALKFTPAGGHISVALLRQGDLARLVVSDDGEGIAPESLPHIFERFYRVDRARARDGRGGYGLGLPISLAVVQAHGGGIQAHSEGIGRGAAITVTLPLAASQSDLASSQTRIQRPISDGAAGRKRNLTSGA